jgi:hypothetical protein
MSLSFWFQEDNLVMDTKLKIIDILQVRTELINLFWVVIYMLTRVLDSVNNLYIGKIFQSNARIYPDIGAPNELHCVC